MDKMMKSVKMRAMNALHFVLLATAMLACWFIAYVPMLAGSDYIAVSLSVCVFYVVFTGFLYRAYNAYKVGLYRISEVVYSQTLANVLSAATTYVFACLLSLRLLNVYPILIAFVVQQFWCLGWSVLANKLYFKLHKPKKTLLIYRGDTDQTRVWEITNYKRRFDVQGKLRDPHDIYQIIPHLDGYGAVIVSGVEATLRNGIVKACIDKAIDCYFVPHTGDVIIAGAKHIPSFSVPVMRARRAMPKPEYVLTKRLFDVACSAIALVIASPVMAGVALAIRLYDGGPALYKQVRLTKDARQFKILKFRSMRVDAEKDGVARLASENDDRITPVGKVIRAVRLDELPQLINILLGEMSFVGPRPERPEIAEQYEKEMPAFSLRLQVKAGLTGTAQVYGRYNTEPRDKLKMDLMYINNMSFVEDIKLMFATARILFMKESTEGVAVGQRTAAVEKEKSA